VDSVIREFISIDVIGIIAETINVAILFIYSELNKFRMQMIDADRIHVLVIDLDAGAFAPTTYFVASVQ
jgi:hypothetical protein